MGLSDFYRCYDCLLANWYAFSRPIQQEADQVRHDLHLELASWHPGKPGPQWGTYSERMNAVFRANGLPELFVPRGC